MLYSHYLVTKNYIVIRNAHTDIKNQYSEKNGGISLNLTSGFQKCDLEMRGYNLEGIWKCF